MSYETSHLENSEAGEPLLHQPPSWMMITADAVLKENRQ
jgi:hypothetical protein